MSGPSKGILPQHCAFFIKQDTIHRAVHRILRIHVIGQDAIASGERVFVYIRQERPDRNTGKTCTSGKRIAVNLGYALRNINLLQIGAARKCAPFNAEQSLGKVDSGQSGTSCKHIFSNRDQVIRKRNTGQSSTILECIISNTCHTFRNCNTRQLGAAKECHPVNIGQPGGKFHFCQSSAARECLGSNGGDTFRKRYISQRCTIVERICAHVGYAGFYVNRCNFADVGCPGNVAAGCPVGHFTASRNPKLSGVCENPLHILTAHIAVNYDKVSGFNITASLAGMTGLTGRIIRCFLNSVPSAPGMSANCRDLVLLQIVTPAAGNASDTVFYTSHFLSDRLRKVMGRYYRIPEQSAFRTFVFCFALLLACDKGSICRLLPIMDMIAVCLIGNLIQGDLFRFSEVCGDVSSNFCSAVRNGNHFRMFAEISRIRCRCEHCSNLRRSDIDRLQLFAAAKGHVTDGGNLLRNDNTGQIGTIHKYIGVYRL